MVVLAASICTRGGKPLLSRQFRDISRDRITALLANFPSLISNSSNQHTSVEDENVRYVYQPFEEFYIVLITNKTSNILQDIDTLHLFASTITNLLRNIDEKEIFDNSFDIIDAFDEIINMGYKENLTLSQVQTFLEMDSHEEKIQEIIERNKELEATEERKRRAKEIQRREMANKQNPIGGGNLSGGGLGGGFKQQPTFQPSYQPTTIVETNNTQNETKSPFSNRPRGGGLQLGKKQTKSSAAASSVTEPLLSNQPVFNSQPQSYQQQQIQQQQSISKSASPAPSLQQQKIPNNGILITINETINARLTRDGSVISSDIKGNLQLRINDQKLSNSKILLKINEKIDKKNLKPHPNVNRSIFTKDHILTVKDKSKTFPFNDQGLNILMWKSTGKNEDLSLLPITITAWVNIDENLIAQVNLEYEITSDFIDSHPNQEDFKIENLKILIPIINEDLILQDNNDAVSYEIIEQGTVFNIESISLEEPQGNFEFSIPIEENEDELFPLEIQFNINNQNVLENDVSLGGISIIDVVTNDDDEKSLPFNLHSNIISETYIVE
ncbi:RET2 [Candida pseudojiufengensis]|uniref:RET2 n=1 Tax=Candida pseudojiufengensis TaxID=497109 RepID=UPI00222470B1|nr:RET2 [Candida pseudojiufengensis]KAI5958733.1 RET2 [Candida pseudojiufengensis]